MTHIGSGRHLYRAGDLAITVSSVYNQLLDEYLSGYLAGSVGTHTLPQFHLTLHTGQQEFARAASEFTHGPTTLIEPVPGVVLTAARTVTGGRCFTIAQDHAENAPAAWAASIAGTTIDLYVPDPSRSPRYVLRIIREAMIRSYEDAGAILFHAAGLDVGGTAVMICGSGGAGKTTALAALLHRLGARAGLLSNDRLLVGDGRQIVAVPLPVPLARSTIEAFPALQAAVPAAMRARHGEIPFNDLPHQFGTTRKLAFPARIFAAAFGAGLAPSSRLAAIIIPALTDTHDPITVRDLDPNEAAATLAACCFTPADEFWRPWLIDRTRPDHDLSVAADQRCRQLATSVPCITVGFGIRGHLPDLEQTLTDVIGALI